MTDTNPEVLPESSKQLEETSSSLASYSAQENQQHVDEDTLRSRKSHPDVDAVSSENVQQIVSTSEQNERVSQSDVEENRLKQDINGFDASSIKQPQVIASSSGRSQMPPNFPKGSLTYDFKPGEFLYNKRIAAFAIGALISLLSLTGKYTISILVTGLLVVYILDFLAMKRWSLVAFWSSLALFWASIYFSSLTTIWVSVFKVFTIMQGSLFIVIIGVWGSLQFEWFRYWNPSLTMMCERILFSVFPVISIPFLMSVIVGTNGIRNAPFFLAFLLCLLVHYFVKPQRSSFKTPVTTMRHVPAEDLYIQKRAECAILSCGAFVLPTFMYFCIYYRVYDFGFEHGINISALSSIPLLFFSLNPEDYFWWSDILKHKAFYQIRTLFIATSLFTLSGWVEYKVIFTRFPHIMALPPPFNYLVVTLATFSVITILVLAIRGEINEKLRTLAIVLCGLAVAFGSLAVGFPILLIPFPAIAAYQLASFYFTRSWTQYTIFAITSTISLFWWLTKSFWFLDYEFNFTLLPFSWSINIVHVILLIMMLYVVTLLTIPMCGVNDLKKYCGPVFIIQAFVLCILEQLLYEQAEGFYSPFLILGTTVAGLILGWNLFKTKTLDTELSTILLAIYCSKFGIFFSPARMALIATFATFLTLTRLYLAVQINEKIPDNFAWGFVCASGFCMFIIRHILMEKILRIFMDTRYYTFTESRLFGAFLLSWGVNIAPLSYGFMNTNKILKRFTVLLLTVGIAWTFWQPSLQASSNDLLDTDFISGTSEWVGWIVVFVVLVVATNFAAPIPKNISQTHLFKLVIFGIASFGIGLAFCGTYLKYATIFSYFFICVAFCSVAFVIYATHFLPADLFSVVYVMYGVFLAMFPVTMLTITIGGISHERYAEELIQPTRVAVIGVFATLSVFTSIMIKFKVSGRPLLKINKKFAAVQSESPVTESSIMIANISAVVGFILSFMLIIWLAPYSHEMYLLLGILLLLLSKDKYLLSNLTDQLRYANIIFYVQAMLVLFFLFDLMNILLNIGEIGFLSGLLKLMGYFFLMGATGPAHILVDIFLYTLKRPKILQVVWVLPLSMFVALVAPTRSILLSAALGAGGVLLQIFTASQWIPIQHLLQ